jgi:hypothetical protein
VDVSFLKTKKKRALRPGRKKGENRNWCINQNKFKILIIVFLKFHGVDRKTYGSCKTNTKNLNAGAKSEWSVK